MLDVCCEQGRSWKEEEEGGASQKSNRRVAPSKQPHIHFTTTIRIRPHNSLQTSTMPAEFPKLDIEDPADLEHVVAAVRVHTAGLVPALMAASKDRPQEDWVQSTLENTIEQVRDIVLGGGGADIEWQTETDESRLAGLSLSVGPISEK